MKTNNKYSKKNTLILIMEIIHDVTIVILLGIILQFIEKCIIHSEK